jgi:major membrane immunogen (membrane-anchored lipoprotein)
MKKKFFAYAILPVLGLALLVGPASTSAMGFGWFGGFGKSDTDAMATRMQNMFQNEAKILGINVDDVKNCWAQGKNIWQCAQDHGITKEQLQQKMKDARAQQLKAQMQALVDKGVITQAQADQRLQWMQNKTQNAKGHEFGKFMKGRGSGGRWF